MKKYKSHEYVTGKQNEVTSKYHILRSGIALGTIFLSFIDYFIIELNTRFNDRFIEILSFYRWFNSGSNKDSFIIEEMLKASLVYLSDPPINSDMNWNF